MGPTVESQVTKRKKVDTIDITESHETVHVQSECKGRRTDKKKNAGQRKEIVYTGAKCKREKGKKIDFTDDET